MKKTKVIIDFDNTIVPSSETIYRLYQKKTRDYSIPYHTKYLWNFEGLIPKEFQRECIELFDEQIFYDELEISKETLEVLKWIKEKYEMIICTKHNPDTVHMKAQWIRNNIPFAKKVVFLMQDDFDKTCVGDETSIIIDDKIECILGNRKLKLLFGDYMYNDWDYVEKEYQKKILDDKGIVLRVNSWNDIKNLLELEW